jgi:hypothetical protein
MTAYTFNDCLNWPGSSDEVMPYRFRKSLNKSGRKAFDNMFDIPHLYKEHNHS